ncbi:MAG TPA: 16S rRNA (guanine(527)-N(7))-methyltransferase RsmG, partial [Pirellulales bacterium]|nr:16S rRNA (guanine(527)-N(7))-methyltransferase RsmG [Pirellulales bacterium]
MIRVTAPPDSNSPTLAAALELRQISLPAEQVERLEEYARLLWEWNDKLNLTRHTDFDLFASRDVADCLALAGPLGEGERVLDVGSGGGVPGVVLAIVRPDLHVTLCESTAKKARALEDIVKRLRLPAEVRPGRAEELLVDNYFDTLTARAVASLAKMLTWFAPHWGSFGRLLAIKGPAWVDERHEARQKNLLSGLQLRKLAS